jgi:glycosyltransferase involved in cell wall biosynthesis
MVLKMSEPFDISFIILTWNSEKYIRRCLESYILSIIRDKLTAEFLVVDNGSLDYTVYIIENDIFPGLAPGCSGRLFRLNNNLGTTKSRNIALKEAAGKYIAICDSDTEFWEGSWLEALNILDSTKTGMLAPCLLYPDRTVQNSVKKFPTIQDKLRKFGKIFLKQQKGSRTDFYDDFPWDRIRPVDTAISACWVFNKILLD